MDKKKFLAVIPARGGSKGLPRKNIKNFAGKPLIAWTIEVAKKSKYLDRIIVSSDDEEIIEVAKKYGAEVPFVRPYLLAKDDTPGIEVILHAIQEINGYENVVLLQPTSPLRTVDAIDGSIEYFIENNANACVTVTESDKSPYWMYSIKENSLLEPIIDGELKANRQQLPKSYVLNGAVYVAKGDWLLENKSFLTKDTIGFTMQREYSLDIDTELDFKIAQFVKKTITEEK